MAGTASGQVGLETTYPYTGTITGTSVRVRAGRGDPSGANNYYYCAVLNRPAKVTVVGGAKGWLMVEPPEGCYSVVLQSAVKLDATGTKGTLTKREWARAAGTARTLQFTAGQKMLKSGDTVEIIGTVVDRFKFYKIKTPPKVYFWIYATYVDKVGAAATVATTDTTGSNPTTRPAGVSTTTRPAGAARPKSTDSATVGVSETQMKDFRAVQTALRTEYGKPVAERDYAGLIAKFKALKFKAGHPLIPFVDYYVKYIEDDVERFESIAAARKLSDDAAKAQKEFADAQAKVTVDVPVKPVTFDAEGIIAESRMFAGMSAVRKRYIVYDQKTHRLNAYVYATDPQIDLSKLIGKQIGVFGDRKYDRGLGAHVIDVKQVEIIDEKAAAPLLGQPAIRTGPKTIPPVKATTRPKIAATSRPGPIIKPIPLIDLVPTTKPAGVKKPAPVIAPPRPRPVPIIRPVPVPVSVPKSVGTIKAAPIPPAKPKAVEVARPKPVEIASPKPVAIARPKPVAVTTPKPVVEVRPELAPVLKPKPAEVVRVRPAPVIRPRPIDTRAAINPIVAKPKPIKTVGPVPVPVVKPKPIDVAKPIVSPKARPLPTTRAALAATTRPAKLIDLESITRLRPTTRPAAAAIDAIPAPAKPVDAGDFPMPLPPSGLPLVDVKKTPTTMPANESEFE
ncbi:MAG: hypothetical protein QGH60_14760 [Phycisphaerae bacterium]|nr:hypothetical protein [Phycisphaerae bacterium]